jgi:hypothetical protein
MTFFGCQNSSGSMGDLRQRFAQDDLKVEADEVKLCEIAKQNPARPPRLLNRPEICQKVVDTQKEQAYSRLRASI